MEPYGHAQQRLESSPGTARISAVSEAMGRLRSAQKPPHGTAAYSRFVNRPVGRRLAALAYVAGLTPNQVSGLSALVTLTAIALLALAAPAWWLGIAVALLLMLGYALDSADGQVARLSGSGSPFGEWLDHMIDCVKINALHLTTAVYIYRSTDLDHVWALVPLAYATVDTVFFFGMVLTDQLLRAGKQTKKQASLSIGRSLVILPSDYGALCLTYVLLAWPTGFLTVYTLMFAGCSLLFLAAVTRWIRPLQALGRRPATS